MSSDWLLLGAAIIGEIGGAIGLRFSDGFTKPVPTAAALAAFALALFLVSRVMKALPVSIAYPIWAGGGTAGVALVGIFALGEPLGILKAAGIMLVIIGVVVLNAASEKKVGC
jgi:small multidrug resistance pump